MKMLGKIFYTLAGVCGVFYSIMYFAEVQPADNFTLGMYCLGFSCMALREVLRE